MEKLVILSHGVVRKELSLDKKEITVGRDPNCDVQLSDPLISRQHAKLVQIFDDYYLEDLNSTNGTLLNKRRVRKHILRHGDVLQVGSYELRFVGSGKSREGEDNLDRTMVVQPKQARSGQHPESRSRAKPAWVRYLGGPNEGETLQLNQSLFTIGRPGEKMAVITRRPQGFFLLDLGGDSFPLINDQAVQAGGVELHHGDVIEVGEHRVQILFGTQG